MRMHMCSKEKLKEKMLENGTSPEKVEEFFNAVSKMSSFSFWVGYDGKYTIVQVGDKAGVASRCRYAKRKDDENIATGISVASFRLLKQLKEDNGNFSI